MKRGAALGDHQVPRSIGEPDQVAEAICPGDGRHEQRIDSLERLKISVHQSLGPHAIGAVRARQIKEPRCIAEPAGRGARDVNGRECERDPAKRRNGHGCKGKDGRTDHHIDGFDLSFTCPKHQAKAREDRKPDDCAHVEAGGQCVPAKFTRPPRSRDLPGHSRMGGSEALRTVHREISNRIIATESRSDRRLLVSRRHPGIEENPPSSVDSSRSLASHCWRRLLNLRTSQSAPPATASTGSKPAPARGPGTPITGASESHTGQTDQGDETIPYQGGRGFLRGRDPHLVDPRICADVSHLRSPRARSCRRDRAHLHRRCSAPHWRARICAQASCNTASAAEASQPRNGSGTPIPSNEASDCYTGGAVLERIFCGGAHVGLGNPNNWFASEAELLRFCRLLELLCPPWRP